jgi:hypothetical protein
VFHDADTAVGASAVQAPAEPVGTAVCEPESAADAAPVGLAESTGADEDVPGAVAGAAVGAVVVLQATAVRLTAIRAVRSGMLRTNDLSRMDAGDVETGSRRNACSGTF